MKLSKTFFFFALSVSTVFSVLIESGKLQHVLHHHSDSIKNLVDRCVAHEGTGGNQLVLFVHVALADTFTHVLAPQLVDGCCGVSSVRIPEGQTERSSTQCSVA